MYSDTKANQFRATDTVTATPAKSYPYAKATCKAKKHIQPLLGSRAQKSKTLFPSLCTLVHYCTSPCCRTHDQKNRMPQFKYASHATQLWLQYNTYGDCTSTRKKQELPVNYHSSVKTATWHACQSLLPDPLDVGPWGENFLLPFATCVMNCVTARMLMRLANLVRTHKVSKVPTELNSSSPSSSPWLIKGSQGP
jgi:hypothetical protein